LRGALVSRSTIVRACFLACLFVASTQSAAAQFLETFGNAGTIRVLQGQIRDGLDQPVSNADITITHVASQKIYELTADENGVFRKQNLPRGEYEVRIHATGFNLAEYTVKIAPSGSKMFVIARLSPGCGSGNSGVALVKRLKDRSFTDEN
jgi:carboxypeptidase family protein